jgi:hypothetical protein
MYLVLITKLKAYFQTVTSKFTITFDGWSNPTLTGFYSVVFHWIDADKRMPLSCILDFVALAPGRGVGVAPSVSR